MLMLACHLPSRGGSRAALCNSTVVAETWLWLLRVRPSPGLCIMLKQRDFGYSVKAEVTLLLMMVIEKRLICSLKREI